MSEELEFKYKGPNYLLRGEDFYISYNPSPCSDIPFFASDDGREETAISYKESWFILNGDFREELKKCAKSGIGEVLKFFNLKEDHYSTWSSTCDVSQFIEKISSNT